MSRSPAELSVDQVLAFLRGPKRTATPGVGSGVHQAYREAAAVLASIPDPGSLTPVGADVAAGGAKAALGDELIPAHGQRFAGDVMLAPEPRRKAVAKLVAEGRVRKALEANPDQRKGELQQHLERYLLGDAPALDAQSLAELEQTHQVVLWLGGVVEDLPTEQAIIARSAWLRLLAPFERIAGDHIFRGRAKELDQLRTYVGVLPPASVRARLTKAAFGWLEPARLPALSISGPGGVGKSALVARFMLEHTRVPDEQRVPFAYLDFDRARLDVGDPVGLSAEMIRQLDIQFPAGGSFGSLRTFAEHQVQRSGGDSEAIGSARSLLADLLGIMSQQLPGRPYVVVLDTFEEVQYRGEARAFPLWDLLGELQERHPFLRVVISGRAPVDSLRLAGEAPRQLPIGDLDRRAALAFIKAQGVRNVGVAQRLYQVFGGVPLTLKLVASLAARYQDDLGDPARRGTALLKLQDEEIQGWLYDRILEHIREPQVQRLASPGLVLRRINPQLILEVLNEPCELGVTSIQEAEQLLHELRKETSLVSEDDVDGDLVHRADLRRVMLKLLARTARDRVERIRRAAVEFYARQTGRRAKAEELYHRLHLGEWVGEEELADREVRASLQTSVVEFDPQIQLHLAGFGFQVPKAVLAEATAAQRDDTIVAQVEELLPYGPSSVAEAARIVAGPTTDLRRPSRLFRSAARVAHQQGDLDRARSWIARGLEPSISAGATAITLELLQEQAWLQRDGPPPERDEALRQLADHARSASHPLALLQHELQSVDADATVPASAVRLLRDAFVESPPSAMWELAPALRPAVRLALRVSDGGILEPLRKLVLADGSPFRYAVFPDPSAQEALDTLLRVGDRDDPHRFGKLFDRLLEGWPYRILYVVPPFGRRGEQLQEAAA